jgi:lysozyme
MDRDAIAAAIRGGGWSNLTRAQQRPYLRAAARVISAIEQDKRMNEPPKTGVGPKAGIAAAIAAAVAIAAPLAMKWEGFAPKQYLDPARIPTWCYGETEKRLSADPSYIYSKAECATLLRERMKRDYAPRIAKCLPEVIHNRFVFGALIDASYNAGWNAVCKSRMAAHIKAGDLYSGCISLEGWYVTARNRQTGKRIKLRGLVNRRLDEKAVCLKGLN